MCTCMCSSIGVTGNRPHLMLTAGCCSSPRHLRAVSRSSRPPCCGCAASSSRERQMECVLALPRFLPAHPGQPRPTDRHDQARIARLSKATSHHTPLLYGGCSWEVFVTVWWSGCTTLTQQHCTLFCSVHIVASRKRTSDHAAFFGSG